VWRYCDHDSSALCRNAPSVLVRSALSKGRHGIIPSCVAAWFRRSVERKARGGKSIDNAISSRAAAVAAAWEDTVKFKAGGAARVLAVRIDLSVDLPGIEPMTSFMP
jgi:hypothetical protein